MRWYRGFTIVELLITLVIVGILASAAFPMAEIAVQRDRERGLREALRTLRTAIDAYKQAGDDGRIERKPGESGYPHTLAELVEGVVDVKNPKGQRLQFLRRIPQDPVATQEGAVDWGIRSYGSPHSEPRPGADIYDVYSKAVGIGLNGVPYREW